MASNLQSFTPGLVFVPMDFSEFLTFDIYFTECIIKALGGLAQLGERLICIQEVIGSIPVSSTRFLLFENWEIG